MLDFNHYEYKMMIHDEYQNLVITRIQLSCSPLKKSGLNNYEDKHQILFDN